jgi:MoaA/NifB/PqqE/SkfB family radical SAM enzyme
MQGSLAGIRAISRSLLFGRPGGRRLPQMLVFFVTSRCNARCDFCLYGDQVAHPTAPEEELTISEVESIARLYGPLNYLALSGGEPFLRRDLEGVCQAFIDHCNTAVISIPSNFAYGDTMVATLEPLLRRNPTVLFDLQMSIDGIGAAHDDSRRVKNLYNKALQSGRAVALLRARHANLRLKASILFLDRNQGEVADIASTLRRELPFDRVQLAYPNVLLTSEKVADPAEKARLSAFRAAAGSMLAVPGRRADFYTAGMRAVQGLYHEQLAQAVSGERNTGSYCEAGRRIVVINERGDVFPCEPRWDVIGNLRESGYDMRRILDGDALARFRNKHLGPGRCNCTWAYGLLNSVPHQLQHVRRVGTRAALHWLRSWRPGGR